MSWQWFFPHDTPDVGAGTAQRPVGIVTTVDVAAGLADGRVGAAVRSPGWVVSGPGRVAVSSAEVSDCARVVGDQGSDAVVVTGLALPFIGEQWQFEPWVVAITCTGPDVLSGISSTLTAVIIRDLAGG